jgi:glycosyltransferase involved in cell wall biosynthesis
VKILRRAWNTLRGQGLYFFVQKAVLRLFPFARERPSLVFHDDALEADWRIPKPGAAVVADRPLRTAWIMSPPGANSGGHQNIFRFLRVLEEAGHHVRIYLYSTTDTRSPREVQSLLAGSSSYPTLKASIEYYPADGIPDDVDAIFATSWETAYRSFRDASDARRFYFVQDFEPLFFPTSSESVLAENTYRFGFYGITAGRWLETKLARDYGMRTSSFDFGSDRSAYHLLEGVTRDSVFFYARPETPRRGFELGVLALELFAHEHPGVPIITAGQSLRRLRLPFAVEDRGNVQVADLGALYNRCAAALVLSLSNLSLLPLELLACGTVPVVNTGENNELVSANPFIAYTPPAPAALADRLGEVMARSDRDGYASRAAESVALSSWGASGEQFLAAVERGMHG